MAIKKKPSDGIYVKRVKPKKETVMIPVDSYIISGDKRELVEYKLHYGKYYAVLRNN